MYKQFPTQINFKIFSNLRAKCKLQNKTDYKNYTINTQNSITYNPVLF